VAVKTAAGLAIAGIVLIVAGIAAWSVPAAAVTAGVFLLAGAYATAYVTAQIQARRGDGDG
jgi:hypothetical protein